MQDLYCHLERGHMVQNVIWNHWHTGLSERNKNGWFPSHHCACWWSSTARMSAGTMMIKLVSTTVTLKLIPNGSMSSFQHTRQQHTKFLPREYLNMSWDLFSFWRHHLQIELDFYLPDGNCIRMRHMVEYDTGLNSSQHFTTIQVIHYSRES